MLYLKTHGVYRLVHCHGSVDVAALEQAGSLGAVAPAGLGLGHDGLGAIEMCMWLSEIDSQSSLYGYKFKCFCFHWQNLPRLKNKEAKQNRVAWLDVIVKWFVAIALFLPPL